MVQSNHYPITPTFVSNLPEILSIFSSCTTVLDIQDSVRLLPPVFHHPVIFVSIPVASPATYGERDTQKGSFISRKTPGKFCYAFVFILPDFANPSKTAEMSRVKTILQSFDFFAPFVLKTFVTQYFIWVTNFPIELDISQSSSSLGGYAEHQGNLIPFCNGGNLIFFYLNHYFAPITESLLPERVIISCPPFSDCFVKIDSMTKIISDLNKFFWVYSGWWNLKEFPPRVEYPKVQLAKINPHRITNLTSFPDFIALWLFDGIENLTLLNRRPIYTFASSRILMYDDYTGSHAIDVLFVERKMLNFLSCYAVGRQISTFGALISPFDATSWLALALSLILVTIFLGRLITLGGNKVDFSFGPLVTFGVMVESSTLSGIEFSLLGKRGNVGFRLVLLVWILSVGTVLTNWYKSYFTFEMIVPFEITAPWRSIIDIEGFRLYAGPLSLLEEGFQLTREGENNMFYVGLRHELLSAMEYKGSSKKFRDYARIAEVWLNGTFDEEFAFKPVSDRLILPLFEPEKFVYNVAKCDSKIAFIDRIENVEKLVLVLNEYYRHNMDVDKTRKYFKKGDSNEERFLSTPIGWEMVSLRSNFVYERLKIAFSSGIYFYWRGWFDRIRSGRDSYNLTNQADKKYDLADVELHSKMSTAFYICGIFLGLSCAVLGVEISIKYWVSKSRRLDTY
ncbi:hypothetical protein Fcan01_17299 [Folsomia candida]|uniref:Uncharacterized protein n=1 Tax=Folsomia candida TaxID=158441 RepID=A0A226DSI2_FOLCA|nr:hypothetical protein Fcan01_17299 [Folsomia candida]